MLADDSTEAEGVVPGGSQEAADGVDVGLSVITRIIVVLGGVG